MILLLKHIKKEWKCRRHYEDKPEVKPKPSASLYCGKIKSKKMCNKMNECNWNSERCSKKKKKD